MLAMIEQRQRDYKIKGIINFDTVTQLYKSGSLLIDRHAEVHFDFSEVDQADSSAVALLLNWLRYAKKKKRKLLFHHIPAQLLEIANVCEVMPFLQKHKD